MVREVRREVRRRWGGWVEIYTCPGVNAYIRVSWSASALLNVRSAELEYGRKEIEENVVRNGDAKPGDWIFDRKCPEPLLRPDRLLPRHAEPVRVKPALPTDPPTRNGEPISSSPTPTQKFTGQRF